MRERLGKLLPVLVLMGISGSALLVRAALVLTLWAWFIHIRTLEASRHRSRVPKWT